MSERVVIVDYGSGNLRSVSHALSRAGEGCAHPPGIEVSADPEAVRRADRVVLPGVGAFGDCRAGIAAIDGMSEALEEAARQRASPFLGICVGMQLMADAGHEYGRHAGFGWIPGEVVKIEPGDPALKAPHMGWNRLALTAAGRAHPVLATAAGRHVYFVHGYHFRAANADDVLASVSHGITIAAAVGHDTLIGLQFHPEKSQLTGRAILKSFLEWRI